MKMEHITSTRDLGQCDLEVTARAEEYVPVFSLPVSGSDWTLGFPGGTG